MNRTTTKKSYSPRRSGSSKQTQSQKQKQKQKQTKSQSKAVAVQQQPQWLAQVKISTLVMSGMLGVILLIFVIALSVHPQPYAFFIIIPFLFASIVFSTIAIMTFLMRNVRSKILHITSLVITIVLSILILAYYIKYSLEFKQP